MDVTVLSFVFPHEAVLAYVWLAPRGFLWLWPRMSAHIVPSGVMNKYIFLCVITRCVVCVCFRTGVSLVGLAQSLAMQLGVKLTTQ